MLAVLGLPPFVLPVVLVLVLSWLVPFIFRSTETDRARVVAERAWKGDPSTWRQTESEAFDLAKDDPSALLILARAAAQNGRTELAEKAIEALKAEGTHFKAARQLEIALLGPLPATSVEGVVLVEAFLREGLAVKAAEKLALFRKRWPEDEELVRLEAEMNREPRA